MKYLLAIGNSFSQDALHYLHQIAKADGEELKVVNLYIGGCYLEKHYNNMLSGEDAYTYEENGKTTDQTISIISALKKEKWDYITLHQSSPLSGRVDSYSPYIDELISYVKANCPSAEVLMFETWAYESDYLSDNFKYYNCDQQKMYRMVSDAYKSVSQRLGVRLIPCGDVIQRLRTKKPFLYGHGGMSICRDGFHMNVIYGRYLLGAVWYKFLLGKSITKNAYIPHTELAPNAIVDQKVLDVIKATVDEML